jgi:hypothetical protein
MSAEVAAPALASRTPYGELLLVVAPAAAVFAYCAFTPTAFNDGDAYWHVAAGRWILAHAAVPHADPFSYTALGRPWVAHEWLAEVWMALAYGVAGMAGPALLAGGGAAAAVAVLARQLLRWLAPLSVIAALGVSLVLLAQHMLARPHMLALPLLALWTAGLLQARRRRSAPSLWLLPLMTLWANLHASYIFGLAIAAPFALEAVLEARGDWRAVAARWAGFAVLATGAALITPQGLAGLVYPFELLGMRTLGWVSEWRPADFARPTPLEFALLFTAFVCIYRGVRMGWIRLALLLGLLQLSFTHVRQEIMLAVVGPLLLAEPLGRALEPRREEAGRPPQGSAWPAAAALAGAMLIIALGRIALPSAPSDSRTAPVTALARVPAAIASQPVFNDYGFGGWLIFSGVRPYIDGRNDMYGDAAMREYVAVQSDASPATSDAVLRRRGVVWTILTPSSPLAARLAHANGWRRLYADPWAVVDVRTAPWPASTAR